MCKRNYPKPALIELDYEERAAKRMRMESPDCAALTLLALRDFGHSSNVGPIDVSHAHSDRASSPDVKTSVDTRSEDSSSVTDDENDTGPPSGKTPQAARGTLPPAKALRSSRFIRVTKRGGLPTGRPLAAPPALASLHHTRKLQPLSYKLC